MKKVLTGLFVFAMLFTLAAKQTVEQIDGSTTLIRSENGNWAGINGRGLIALLQPHVVLRKTFSLNELPPEVRSSAVSAALRMHLGIVDYSIYDKVKKSPGLKEKFQIAINGHTMDFETSDKRFPLTDNPSKRRRHEWMTLPFPAEWLRESDTLTVSIRKLDGTDDYIYMSIDPTVVNEHSFISGNTGKNFHPTGKAQELMIRLAISTSADAPVESNPMLESEACTLIPAEGKSTGLPIFGYFRQEENAYRFEITPGYRDLGKPMTLLLEGADKARCFDTRNNKIEPPQKSVGGALLITVPPKTELAAVETPTAPRSVTARLTRLADSVRPVRVQQAVMQPPKGAALPVRDICRISGKNAEVDNGTLRMKMNWTSGHLRITELYSYIAQTDLLTDPAKVRLFIVRIGDKDFDIANSPLQSAEVKEGKLTLTFAIPGSDMLAVCRIGNAGEEIVSSLDVINNGKTLRNIKVVHPTLEGLKLSAKPEDDFYLCPTEGGLIANAPCWRREGYGYGGGYCLFAIMDIFSPECGSGFYMRANDPAGEYKHLNFRKGGKITVKGDQELRLWPIMGRLDLPMHYGTSLRDFPGTGLAIDYIERECAPGEKMRYPEAALGAHPGDWHRAMEIYAAWSHKTWPRHHRLSPLANIWNAPGGYGTAQPLVDAYKNPNYPGSRADMTEINGYWTVCEKNSWGAPITGKKGWIFKDPVTGKLVRSYNRGDYGAEGYNPQWGGLPALQEFIRRVRTRMPVMLYTVPRICDSETKLAREHMPQWCAINPVWHFRKKNADPRAPKTPENLIFHYNAYRVCMENPEYQKWLVENLVRVVKETGASGIRLDEFGSPGEICLSTLHPHVPTYRRRHNNHLQAISAMMRDLRAAMTREVGPDVIITSEFIGHDMYNAPQDGALNWLVASNNYAVNPAPINLFRFYFPGCKVFEIDEFRPGAAKRQDWRYWLWNAVGVYNSGLYPVKPHKILRENTDAMGSGKATPLIPSCAPYILINRFESKEKTIWTVLNSDRHTYCGAIMPASDGRHYEELLENRKLTLRDGKLFTTIRPGEVLVIRSK